MMEQQPPLPVHIVGLDDAYRGAALEEQLRVHNVAVYRAPALDARELDAKQLADLVDDPVVHHVVHRGMTPSEVGCAVSHARTYESIVRAGAPWSVVMEDDARLTPHFGVLPTLLERLPTSRPTVLLLWAYPDYAVLGRPRLTLEGANSSEITVRRAITPPIGACAYVMNQKAAVLAHERTKERPVAGLADWPVAWAYDADFLLAWPGLAQPDPSVASTIQASRAPFERTGFEGRISKFRRHVESVVGLRYLRWPSAYPGFRQFYRHEVVRPLSLAIAKRHRGRVTSDRSGPRTISAR